MLGQGESRQIRDAYTEVINRYSKNLFDFGIRFCQDDDVVKDAIQQLFLDLWNKGFDLGQRDTLKAYLFKAIRNRVLREQAKWNKNQPLNDEHDFMLEFDIEHQMIAEATDLLLAEKVKCLLNTLPSRQREIIYLRFYEDLDIVQISDVMSINRQSAHNLLQKAYQKIRGDWQLVMFIFGVLQARQLMS
ncbi:putative RNA polymerase sigma factor [Pedobacter sp. BAL39]|uniref:RNA polymerase sigma factor n=1 Tax=Pedobacter sp. BAL39 TaxID=391596 RepID=UPI000155A5AB|nr:sigma-70 family RNA polymerase sigma factor [Pedobacter sp. BAL39]EDM34209.1 putative RNA polymerase sigma factor [Pedobacter sp. BAL39]